MASTTESATEVASEVEPAAEALRIEETKASRRSFYKLESGRLVPCEPNEAQIIGYISPTIDDEAELQEHYNIDYHTLQSSLDPDELSRLELEPDHAAIIFKRPRSFCADDNFLLKLTSTGIFVYKEYLVIVMADDSSIFEGRVPCGFLLPQGCHLRFPCCEIVCQLQALGIEFLYRGHLGLSQDELMPLAQVLHSGLYPLRRLFEREFDAAIGLGLKQHFENVLALLRSRQQ